MIKKLATVATLALLTAACSGTLCQSRNCNVVISDASLANGGVKPVLFDFDSATLTTAGKDALNGYVTDLKSGDKVITVAGYTDSTGSEDYNLKLSERRAESAKAYLVKKGVPAARLTTKGYGETNFVADNGTAAGRAQNRRIELEY